MSQNYNPDNDFDNDFEVFVDDPEDYDDEYWFNTEGEDFEEDADDDRGFQNPVFGSDETDLIEPEEKNIDDLLKEFGL